jgi:HEAT repeat protein
VDRRLRSRSAHPAPRRLTIDSADLAITVQELLSGDERRAESAATSLPAFGRSALQALLTLAASPQADSRWWAVRALAGFTEADAQACLIRCLEDMDPSVRQCAALGLRHHPTGDAVPALARAMADDDTLVSRLAADALAACGALAVGHLQQALLSEHPRVRIEATRALAAIRDPSAIPALFAALRDPTPLVEHWASRGLEALGQGMVYFKP